MASFQAKVVWKRKEKKKKRKIKNCHSVPFLPDG